MILYKNITSIGTAQSGLCAAITVILLILEGVHVVQ
jgi:hypothetical protein